MPSGCKSNKNTLYILFFLDKTLNTTSFFFSKDFLKASLAFTLSDTRIKGRFNNLFQFLIFPFLEPLI